MKMKRIAVILACLCMVLTLLPGIALAAGNLWDVAVCGIFMGDGTVYFKNGDTSTGTGSPTDYNARFDPASGKLYLNGLDVHPAEIGIFTEIPIEIVLESASNSIVTSGGNSAILSSSSNSAVAVSGSGSLSVAGDSTNTINTAGLTVKNGVTLTATSNITAVLVLYAGCDVVVQAGGKLVATGAVSGLRAPFGKLIVDGGEVEAVMNSNNGNNGIDADSIEVKNGGKLTGTSCGAWGYGVVVSNDITVSGSSELTGTATGTVEGMGVCAAYGSIIVTDSGKLTGTSTSEAGVWADQSITVSDKGMLTGTTSASNSEGIFSRTPMSINGGAVTASSRYRALSKIPDMSGYAGCVATASVNKSGTPRVPFDPSRYSNYKYFYAGPTPLPITIVPDAAFLVGASGGDRTVTVGHGTGLAVGDIGALSVDGTTLTEGTDYTKAPSASVDITLKESWLNALPAGTHQLHVPVTGGALAPQMPYIDIVVSAPGGADIPKTGDGALPGLWLLLCLLGGAGLFVASKKRRRA